MTGLSGSKNETEFLKKAEDSLSRVLANTERTSTVAPVLIDALTKVRGLLWICENSIMLNIRKEFDE